LVARFFVSCGDFLRWCVSRIGKKPVSLPDGVRAVVRDDVLEIAGPRGLLSLTVVDGVSVLVEGGQVLVQRAGDSGDLRSKHGLVRALVRNMVEGVSGGFTRRLEIQGIGYRAEVKGSVLVLSLGYSHAVEFPIPSDVRVAVEKDGKVAISGADKGRVGQVAAIIRRFRPPDRYKGKGVRFEGERVILKEGKSA
jgi:large subunit ribosomal protein L6